MIVGDAEKIDYAAELAGEEFDVILFADVLEHLKQPGDVLRRVRPFVAENGVVIASIPNVAHGSVRLALLGGEFRYRDWGLLDDTHLRFFTRASIQDLFEETGYVVTHWLRQRLDVGETEISVPNVPDAVREWLASDPETTTYQFVLRALVSEHGEPAEGDAGASSRSSGPTGTPSAQLAAARQELGELRPLREEVASLRAEIEAVRRAHAVQGQRLVNERVAFAEGLAHVHAVVYGSRSWRLTAPLRVGDPRARPPARTMTALALPAGRRASRLRRHGHVRQLAARAPLARGAPREHRAGLRADRRRQRLARRDAREAERGGRGGDPRSSARRTLGFGRARTRARAGARDAISAS